MKKIKILTILLLIITLIMIGFFGVYKQVQNRMENQIPNFSYAMDLEGNRTIRLKVSQSTKTIIKDAEGKEVEDAEDLTDEQLKEKGYVKEEIPYNKEEDKKIENYQKAKEVIEKRLKELGIEDYIVRLNEQNGEVVIETPEGNNMDTVVEVINTPGKFELTDSQTGEVLLNNDNIKEVLVASGRESQTATAATAYIDIKFNEEGTKKLKEITGTTYKKIEKSTTNTTDSENTTSDTNTANSENTTSNTNTTESETTNSDDQKEEEQKTIDVKIDDDIITTTSFEKAIETGNIQLTAGAATSDVKTLQDNILRAKTMSAVFNAGKLPLIYEVAENQYIQTDITSNNMQTIGYIAIVIIAIAIIILIIRYKLLGAFVALAYVGFIACIKPILVLFNVVLSIEGFVAIAMTLILNYILVNNLLKKSYKIDTYKAFFIKILPIFIIAIVFSFISWTPIRSFGYVTFWGVILMAIYNLAITGNLIRIEKGEEK